MAKKILIVEDDTFLGDVLVKKLTTEGYTVSLSRDGTAGLSLMRREKPDLVLLDIILPQMNGYEVLEEKQKDATIAAIPVIVISNSGQPLEINRALTLGVRDYLVKAQFDPEEVLMKVRLQLDRAGRAGGEKSAASAAPYATVSPRSAAPSGGASLKGKKILWVEDDSFLSDIISRKLSGQNSELFHAEDGEHALKLLAEKMPDLVLLDILLPGVNGFEVLKKIKENSATKKIPVILLSNLGQQADIDKGRKLGAARFLVKATVTLDEIVEEIAGVLQEAGK